MYFLALAADYDGTIAKDGAVAQGTLDALERFKRTGHRLILVTGRRIPSLVRAFPGVGIFDRVVAENGAVLFDPETQQETSIASPPPHQLVDALTQRGVTPLHVGHSIIATWEPHDKVVLEEIKRLGLELQIIFNKGAVMVLPPGVNKASGLDHALRDLGISAKNVVAVGDAENDHALLRACGCSAAVANALATVKDDADLRLAGEHGYGVAELVDLMLGEAVPLIPPTRHDLLVGKDRNGREIRLRGYNSNVLIAGQSGVGKSTIATALTERMAEAGFNFCVFDPEGDYSELTHSVCVGDARSPPVVDEALDLVRKVAANVVINTQALSLADRPRCFDKLIPRLLALRASSGRPHWIVVDEAHHQIDARRTEIDEVLPERVHSLIFITVHPDAVSAQALRTVKSLIAVGDKAGDVIASYCEAVGLRSPPEVPGHDADEVLFWDVGGPIVVLKPILPKQARERHKTKYAEGELEPDRSFYFRGPEGRLRLRAQNLMLFLQIAEGVDEATWEHHRRLAEYSGWFRTAIKDEELARETALIEKDEALDAKESRLRIGKAVSSRYTVSSSGSRNWHERGPARVRKRE